MEHLQHLAITCGGTGGHFNPGLSIAQAFQAMGGDAILLLGGKHADKQLKTAADAGIKAYKITASPLSKNPLKLPRFLLNVNAGWKASKKIMKEHQVQALLSMGSYTSIPPFLAAKSLKIPFFLHDGNARLGKANLTMSRFARSFAFSFPSVNASAVRCPAVLTGFPLRAAILNGRRPRAEAIAAINERFGTAFEASAPVLLVFGGSLGAEKINSNIAFDPTDPTSATMQVIHLSGPGKKEQALRCYEGLPNKTLVLEAFEDIGLLYAAADFVISRAGGSTVSELAYYGKYALLVPYPFAAQHHQDDNAAWFASAGGAEIVQDSACSREFFVSLTSRWLKDRAQQIEAGKRNESLAMPDAALNVLKMIDSAAHVGNRAF